MDRRRAPRRPRRVQCVQSRRPCEDANSAGDEDQRHDRTPERAEEHHPAGAEHRSASETECCNQPRTCCHHAGCRLERPQVRRAHLPVDDRRARRRPPQLAAWTVNAKPARAVIASSPWLKPIISYSPGVRPPGGYTGTGNRGVKAGTGTCPAQPAFGSAAQTNPPLKGGDDEGVDGVRREEVVDAAGTVLVRRDHLVDVRGCRRPPKASPAPSAIAPTSAAAATLMERARSPPMTRPSCRPRTSITESDNGGVTCGCGGLAALDLLSRSRSRLPQAGDSGRKVPGAVQGEQRIRPATPFHTCPRQIRHDQSIAWSIDPRRFGAVSAIGLDQPVHPPRPRPPRRAGRRHLQDDVVDHHRQRRKTNTATTILWAQRLAEPQPNRHPRGPANQQGPDRVQPQSRRSGQHGRDTESRSGRGAVRVTVATGTSGPLFASTHQGSTRSQGLWWIFCFCTATASMRRSVR